MRYYKIFLASSNELRTERLEFIAGVHSLNKDIKHKEVALDVEYWEDMDDAFNTDCKQTDYNEYLEQCDLFVMLIWNKVGKYSNEEFDLAYKLFTEKKLPRVYVYEKTPVTKTASEEEKKSKQDFLSKLNQPGKAQFQSLFERMDTVILKLKDNMKRLFDDPDEHHFVYGRSALYESPAILLSPNGAYDPSVFFGRQDELITIRERLREHGKLMLINAEGGIGKTTLAARYWNESLYQYKYNAWLFCENGIMAALKELAPKIDVDLSAYDTEATQLQAIKLALSEKQDDLLLVLDNANSPGEINAFRMAFEGFHWHVLLTSRCAGVLDESEELPIRHLPPPLAKALFIKYYNEPDNTGFDALLYRLLEAIQYNTLLVEIFAKNMREASEMHLYMHAFLQKLETGGLHLGAHSFEINSEYGTKRKAATTDEILDALYDFSILREHERFVLLNLAFLPSVPYELSFLFSLFTTHETEKDYRDTIKALVKTGWISNVEKTYKLSPVIQKLAVEKNTASIGSDARYLLYRLNAILEDDSYNLLNITIPNAKQYIDLAYDIKKHLCRYPSDDLGNYLFAVSIYFKNIGDIVEERNYMEAYRDNYKGLLIAEPGNLDYKYGLAISYGKLGGVYEAKGDWDNALINYKETNRLLKEIYDNSPETLSYKNGLAISYEKLGGVYEAKGDWDNALNNYKERNRLGKEICDSSPDTLSYKNGLAISHSKLGGVYEAKGDWDNALINYQEDFRLTKEIYDSSPETLSYKNGLAVSYDKLGNVYEAKGDWDNALSNYQEQLRICKEINASSPETLSYKNGLAISYSKLGGVYEAKGDWDNALSNYQEDFRLTKEIYDSSPETLSYKNGLAISYFKLGGVYDAKGDWDNALINYEEQLRICKEIYDSSPETLAYKNGLAISYSKLGGVYEAKGDWDNALINYKERNRLGKEIYDSSPETLEYKNGLAISYSKLGTLYLAQDDYGKALENFMEGRAHFEALWQKTNGQVVLFTYYFAISVYDVCRIVKFLIIEKSYPENEVENITASIKQMRRQAYEALKPLAENGLLQYNQKWLHEELADVTWYAF